MLCSKIITVIATHSHPDLANKMHSQQTIIEEAKGDSWIFHIPEIPKEVIVPWILSQGGNAIPLEPQIIVDEVRKKATSILQFLN